MSLKGKNMIQDFVSVFAGKMSSPKFCFAVSPAKNASSDADNPGSEMDCMYKHPSSEEAIFDTHGAICTLVDLSRSIFLSGETETPSPKPATTEMIHEGTRYSVATLNDSRSNLLLLFALERAAGDGGSHSCRPKDILDAIHKLLTFLTTDLETNLADEHFRSDLDGLIFYIINSLLDHLTLDDISLSLSAYDQSSETEHLDTVVLSFEAGDFFDQDTLEDTTGSIYVAGTSVYFKEVLISSHMAPALLQDVCLFMRLHRKGFRRLREVSTSEDRTKSRTSVVRVFPSSEAASVDAETYLVWCSKDDVTVCACVELFGLEEDSLATSAALIEIVVRGCMTTLAHPVVDKCSRLLKRKPEFFPWQSWSRSSKASSVSSSDNNDRSFSEKLSVSGMSTASVSSKSSYSSSTSSTTSDAPTVIRVPVSPTSSSGPTTDLIYRLVVDREKSLVSFQSFLDDSRKAGSVPPSLQKDFLVMVTRIRAHFKKKRKDRQELALRISYPPPTLSKFYWVSGWNLPEKSKEMFVCYPDGAEESALLQAFTA